MQRIFLFYFKSSWILKELNNVSQCALKSKDLNVSYWSFTSRFIIITFLHCWFVFAGAYFSYYILALCFCDHHWRSVPVMRGQVQTLHLSPGWNPRQMLTRLWPISMRAVIRMQTDRIPTWFKMTSLVVDFTAPPLSLRPTLPYPWATWRQLLSRVPGHRWLSVMCPGRHWPISGQNWHHWHASVCHFISANCGISLLLWCLYFAWFSAYSVDFLKHFVFSVCFLFGLLCLLIVDVWCALIIGSM